jgi:hypothetical protein
MMTTEGPDQVIRGLAVLISLQHPDVFHRPEIVDLSSRFRPETIQEILEIVATIQRGFADLATSNELLARLRRFTEAK